MTPMMMALFAAGLALAAPLTSQAQATDFPNRTVRLVVPFPPGGTLDIVGRLIAKELSEKWGQTVIVDNRAGASGNIGVDNVARSEPDGYSMVIVAPPVLTTPHLQKVPYNVLTDVVPVVQTATIEYVFAAHKSLGVKNIEELIALVKKNPGKFDYASAGPGSGQHLQVELLKGETGMRIVHIPYRGSGPALQALLAGEVQLMFDTSVGMLPLVQSGKVVPLMVTGTKPMAQLPGVPAMGQRFPSIYIEAWHGIMVAAGTPKPIVDKIARDVREVVLSTDVANRFRELGFQPTGVSPTEFAAIVKRDLERWGKLIRDNNIKLE